MPTISAHHHKTDQHSVKDLNSTYQNSYGIGCLCRLSEAYLPVNSWNWGFLEMYEQKKGQSLIKNRRVIDGDIV